MPISTNQILAEIGTLLAPLAKDAKQSAKHYDLYEALTLGLVAKSAGDAGATVGYLDTTLKQATAYLFRSSPGPLANPS
jgi:hypothetical protein